MKDKFIKKEVLTCKIDGKDVPMGTYYSLENGVKYTPELLKELISLNQEIIDAHKAIVVMLNTYQTSLSEMSGLPKAEGMTWKGLALSILELTDEFQELEAMIAIQAGENKEPLKVIITEIEPVDDCGENGLSYFINCWGDLTEDWPSGEISTKPNNSLHLN